MWDYDTVRRGTALKLEYQVGGDVMGGKGCRRECRTIEKACTGVLESIDDEVGEQMLRAARSKRAKIGELMGEAICGPVRRAQSRTVDVSNLTSPRHPEGHHDHLVQHRPACCAQLYVNVCGEGKTPPWPTDKVRRDEEYKPEVCRRPALPVTRPAEQWHAPRHHEVVRVLACCVRARAAARFEGRVDPSLACSSSRT